MPMDGVMLGFVARELDSVLRDGRVDRVIQPEKDEIHLLIRAGGANHRLVLSASASAARAHLSSHAKTGPMEPPMLCMLFLRKYLCGGRVLSVQRIAGDRILKIDISNLSELGDPVTRTLVVEIMGRHSTHHPGGSHDAARHQYFHVRQIILCLSALPGQARRTPPRAPAILRHRSPRQAANSTKLSAHPSPVFSPQAAREAAARCQAGRFVSDC